MHHDLSILYKKGATVILIGKTLKVKKKALSLDRKLQKAEYYITYIMQLMKSKRLIELYYLKDTWMLLQRIVQI